MRVSHKPDITDQLSSIQIQGPGSNVHGNSVVECLGAAVLSQTGTVICMQNAVF